MTPDPKPKCVYIELRFDDGTKRIAEGDHAQQVLDWWNACETMNFIHGAEYKGQTLIEVKP